MGTVIGATAAKVLEVEDNAVNGGTFDAFGHLILTKGDGSEVDVGSATATIVDATDTVKGITMLASDAETVAGTDATQAVTPLSLAALTSTATRKGLVELATSAEAITGTDTARAVTPAGVLAVRVTSGISEASIPSAYPAGTSIQAVSSGWSLNGGVGTVVTDNVDTTHAQQTFYANAGGTQFSQAWIREYHTTNGGGGWTAWMPFRIMVNLTPASFAQSTAFTSYPQGDSRLIYTTANSTSWDFSGKAGEVMTYKDSTTFARQIFTEHQGGANTPAIWVRTANAGSGWSNWNFMGNEKLPFAFTAGVISLVTVTSNVIVSGAVTFPAGLFTANPILTLGAGTTVPGSEVSGVGYAGTTTSGATIYIRRSTPSTTAIGWMAVQMSP